MIGTIFKSLFGSKNDRELKRMGKIVEKINEIGTVIQNLSDEQLASKTAEFRDRLKAGESLDDLLPEAFAVVREASSRVMSMRHFDVQLIGGITLHEGRIAEMRTGEGKTLVATLPAYLNALTGQGVHVVTVNDYLAQRDADWMRPLYEFLGLTVGVVVSGQSTEEKHQAYQADITYGTNNEFGFDYLRDNMVYSYEQRVQRPLAFAIVDEVDSILIDEARTPLIISGPAADSSQLYKQINALIPRLQPPSEEDEGDFTIDEKARSVELTEAGHEKVEDMLTEIGLLPEGESLYAGHNLNLLHHVNAGLQAHYLFTRDVDYIVQGGQIVIVDEHTGRTMPGRRWSNGIHQAIEAKEKVNIQNENQTLASTTFQNYFRLYGKLAGMTGTADTEAVEFRQIYGLDVVVIPTHRPMIRKDMDDLVFLTQEEKFEAIIEQIQEITEKGAPVLVGTASIETSELLSRQLKKLKIKHQVLNAKFHKKEAEIIALAGKPGAVTIATNMAGRGTDIMLGGNWKVEAEALENPSERQIEELKQAWQKNHEKVIAAGGLHIIGTERHESRRIDNQLRGRAGRQGDPGYTRFYLSLEDSLMRIFASDRVRNMMQSIGMQRGEAIEHRWVSRAIENAQRKVEGRNFDIRKSLLEYDDVANDQRRVIYRQREDILLSEDISDSIQGIFEEALNQEINAFIPPGSVDEQWDIEGLENFLKREFLLDCPVAQWLDQDDHLYEEGLREKIVAAAKAQYQEKEDKIGSENARSLEKQVMLQVLDKHWKEHLAQMDYLRQGIHLRGYAQKNPKQEYKREAFEMFQDMLAQIKQEITRILLTIQVRSQEEIEALEEQRRLEAEAELARSKASHVEPDSELAEEENTSAGTYTREQPKVGRNDPCPCGSGKKYKHCHGKIA